MKSGSKIEEVKRRTLMYTRTHIVLNDLHENYKRIIFWIDVTLHV